MAKHDLGDMEAIRQTLETWLRQHLPDATDLALGELSFPEESGESSVSLILKADVGGQQQRYVCRMKPRISQVFDEHDLPLQYNVMSAAAAHGVPVPPLLGFEADESLVDSDFYIMGFIDGQIPTDNPPYAFGSWVTELSAEERATMWRNGLEVIANIHQIDLGSFDTSGVPSSAPGQPAVQYEIDKLNAMISPDVEVRMSDVFKEAVRYVSEHMPRDDTRTLCWGDSRVGNVIWNDLKPAAILDWEMAGIGNPLQDVSWWYWVDFINSVGLGVERLTGLPSLDEIYGQWHELTGLPTDNTAYFDLFSVVRYAVILENKFVSMEQAGMGSIDNFVVPYVEQQLERLRG